MKAAWGFMTLTFVLILTPLFHRVGGGWRGLRSPRIAIPLLAMVVGGICMVAVGVRPGMTDDGADPSGTEMAVFIAGLALFVGSVFFGMGSFASRLHALHSAMERLDGYLQGSEPLPFPSDDWHARHDLALIAVLLEDPALSHRYPVEVRARVTSLGIGGVLP